MPISIQGTQMTIPRALAIIVNDDRLRSGMPNYYFDNFCLNIAVRFMDAQAFKYISVADFIQEVRTTLQNEHLTLATRKHLWRGKTANGTFPFTSIPHNYQASVRNLINNGNPLPGHLRMNHNTNPTGNRVNGTSREYDLSANREGRLTTLVTNNRRAFYYSRHHAAATYEYLLLTDAHGRPIFRGEQGAGTSQILNIPF